MLFQGKSHSAELLDNGIVEFKFDAQGSVNKFDQETFKEYREVVSAINSCSDAKGVLVTSGKSSFIVGADITEFLDMFKKPEAELIPWIKQGSDVFDSFEELLIFLVDRVDNFCGRNTINKLQYFNLSAICDDFFSASDLFDLIVTTFDQHIGTHLL